MRLQKRPVRKIPFERVGQLFSVRRAALSAMVAAVSSARLARLWLSPGLGYGLLRLGPGLRSGLARRLGLGRGLPGRLRLRRRGALRILRLARFTLAAASSAAAAATGSGCGRLGRYVRLRRRRLLGLADHGHRVGIDDVGQRLKKVLLRLPQEGRALRSYRKTERPCYGDEGRR